ncbi:unnamed protein product [Penicillium bialowiezense]
MASTALDQVPEGGELVEVEPGNPPKHDELGISSEFDELEDFRAVMASMSLNGVAAYVSHIRKSIHPDKQADAFSVTEIGSPMYGSFNICYPVTFEDGVRWLLKVPACGTQGQFSDADAESLRSEALTMRLLRRETTIPLPEVFAFESSCKNELNCPFILMSYVEGRKLSDVWFDKESPKDIVQALRTRALQDIAAAMVQLDKYSFDQGGPLVFDHQNQLSGIGSVQHSHDDAELEPLADKDPDGSPVHSGMGPYLDPKAWYEDGLDHQLNRAMKRDDIWDTGLLRLLQMSVDSIQEPCDGRKPFVLTHPDFNSQNIIVAEDGELRAMIDWDGVYSAPRSMGNEAYPSWLTRDWDPSMYGWNEDMERGIKREMGGWEDSPDTLKFYRSVYASAIRAYQHNGPEDPTTATITTKSLIYHNLAIATEITTVMQDELPQKAKQEIESETDEEDLQQQAKQEIESETDEEDLQQQAKQEIESETDEEDLQQQAKQEIESETDEEDLQQQAKQEIESETDEEDESANEEEVESANEEQEESANEEEEESANEEEIESEKEIDFVSWAVFDALGENRLSERYRNILMTGLQRLVERSAQL